MALPKPETIYDLAVAEAQDSRGGKAHRVAKLVNVAGERGLLLPNFLPR